MNTKDNVASVMNVGLDATAYDTSKKLKIMCLRMSDVHLSISNKMEIILFTV